MQATQTQNATGINIIDSPEYIDLLIWKGFRKKSNILICILFVKTNQNFIHVLYHKMIKKLAKNLTYVPHSDDKSGKYFHAWL